MEEASCKISHIGSWAQPSCGVVSASMRDSIGVFTSGLDRRFGDGQVNMGIPITAGAAAPAGAEFEAVTVVAWAGTVIVASGFGLLEL